MRTYPRAPVEFVRGEGALLWDAEGREYLDFLTGISVCSVGHCHPAVVEAVREQAGRLIHVSNLFYTEPMVRLAERLSESSLGGRVFFSNSGTEANECAIKIARKHAHGRGIERAGDRQLRGRLPRPHLRRALGDPALAANEALGPMLPGLPLGAPQRRRGAARGGRRAHRGGPDRADPGRGGRLPDQRRGAARRPRGLRRGGRAADPRRDPDRDGADRLALGLRADPGAARRDDHARRRSAAASRSAPASTTPEAGEVLEPGDHGSTFAGGAGGRRRGARRARDRRRPGPAARRARAGRVAARRACWRSTACARCAAAA